MTTDAVQQPNFFLRYWYLWLTVIVLSAAAATGFRESMEIQIAGASLHLFVWQFVAGVAAFLLLVGVVHCMLDRRQISLPRWIKTTHLAFSAAFCVLTFVYLQKMYADRMSGPQAYFGVENRYYDDLNLFIYGFLILFALAQLVFAAQLIRLIRRR